jgi:hypothetical protein
MPTDFLLAMHEECVKNRIKNPTEFDKAADARIAEAHRLQETAFATIVEIKERRAAELKQQLMITKQNTIPVSHHETDVQYKERMEDLYNKREIANSVALAHRSKNAFIDKLPTVAIDSVERRNKFIVIGDNTPRSISLRISTISNINQENNVVIIQTTEFRNSHNHYWKLATNEDAIKFTDLIHEALS